MHDDPYSGGFGFYAGSGRPCGRLVDLVVGSSGPGPRWSSGVGFRRTAGRRQVGEGAPGAAVAGTELVAQLANDGGVERRRRHRVGRRAGLARQDQLLEARDYLVVGRAAARVDGQHPSHHATQVLQLHSTHADRRSDGIASVPD